MPYLHSCASRKENKYTCLVEDCIFCKIVLGQIPSFSVYEDERFIGFLDISPVSSGHTLLIPRQHYRWVYDVPNFGLYWETAKQLALTIQKKTLALSISYLTVGDQVPHAHIHIIPRFKDGGGILELKNIKKVSTEELKETAKKIRG